MCRCRRHIGRKCARHFINPCGEENTDSIAGIAGELAVVTSTIDSRLGARHTAPGVPPYTGSTYAGGVNAQFQRHGYGASCLVTYRRYNREIAVVLLMSGLAIISEDKSAFTQQHFEVPSTSRFVKSITDSLPQQASLAIAALALPPFVPAFCLPARHGPFLKRSSLRLRGWCSPCEISAADA